MTGALAVARGRTFRSLQRHHNFRVVFAGQVVSMAGTWMQNVALAWLVLDLSHSPFAIGMFAFWRLLPTMVLGPFAGVIVDRFDTRRVVAVTQAVLMAVSVLLFVITVSGRATLPLVYALAFLGGVPVLLDVPSRSTLTFELVGRAELTNAVALMSGVMNAARVVGPALAGLVIATSGTATCFALNAASFVAVLVALALVRKDELYPVEKAPDARVLAGTLEGLRYAFDTPETRRILLTIVAVGLFGINSSTLVPFLASDNLEIGARTFGVLSACLGTGALVGALVSASVRHATWKVFALGVICFSLSTIGLALLHNPVPVGVLLVAVGLFYTLFASTANALLQLAAPDQLRGRVVALYLYAFIGLAPIGGLLFGVLAEHGGTLLAFGTAGLTGLLVIALMWPRAQAHEPRLESAPVKG